MCDTGDENVVATATAPCFCTTPHDQRRSCRVGQGGMRERTLSRIATTTTTTSTTIGYANGELKIELPPPPPHHKREGPPRGPWASKVHSIFFFSAEFSASFVKNKRTRTSREEFGGCCFDPFSLLLIGSSVFSLSRYLHLSSRLITLHKAHGRALHTEMDGTWLVVRCASKCSHKGGPEGKVCV